MYCWDCQAPSKGVSAKIPPHPQISSLGFRMNIEWERMDTTPPTTLQEDISALLLIWDTVVSIQSLRSSAVNSTVWAEFLLPLDFPCDLPQPLAQALLFPGMQLGCMAEWNMDTALSMLSLCLILSCYWLCASGLSKMHTRNLKNSHAVPYPSIRIYYMLTHKSHKGFKDTFSLKKNKSGGGNYLGKSLSSSPFAVSKPFSFGRMVHQSLSSPFLLHWTFILFWAHSGAPGKGAPTQGKSGQKGGEQTLS